MDCGRRKPARLFRVREACLCWFAPQFWGGFFSGVSAEKTTLWIFGQDYFIFLFFQREEKRVSKVPHINQESRSTQRGGGELSQSERELDDNSHISLSSFYSDQRVLLFFSFSLCVIPSSFLFFFFFWHGGYETSRCEHSSALSRCVHGRLPSVNVKATAEDDSLTRRNVQQVTWKKKITNNRGSVKRITYIISSWVFF